MPAHNRWAFREFRPSPGCGAGSGARVKRPPKSLISSAVGFLKLKRGYWVIESRLHHALDVTLGEDRSRVHNSKAAFALSLFRRVVVSFAQVWLEECRKLNPRSRATTRKFQKRFLHRNGGPARLQALIFSKSPDAWRLPK
jgi:hypothetical protein